MRPRTPDGQLFELGRIHLSTGALHTVKPLEADFPKGKLTVITGVSGSGKTTLILESLIPGLEAAIAETPLPEHVRSVSAEGIERIKLIDATPIGINVRSTVATYAGVHDELRKLYARSPAAKAAGYKAGSFSYNTGNLRCPICDGTGVIDLDVQFLPDVDIPCPELPWLPLCPGGRPGASSCPGRGQLLAARPDGTWTSTPPWPPVRRLENRPPAPYQVLRDLGLGYLTLGEATPSLSGGEAQRLKLASEMGRGQSDTIFVFDEPTIGLHPLDVKTLLGVFQTLHRQGRHRHCDRA